jgi:hypothetical protein
VQECRLRLELLRGEGTAVREWLHARQHHVSNTVLPWIVVSGMRVPARHQRRAKITVNLIKDLQDSIKDRRALAKSRDDAAIVLVVMGRETAQVTAGFLGDPARDRVIRVKFHVGG